MTTLPLSKTNVQNLRNYTKYRFYLGRPLGAALGFFDGLFDLTAIFGIIGFVAVAAGASLVTLVAPEVGFAILGGLFGIAAIPGVVEARAAWQKEKVDYENELEEIDKWLQVHEEYTKLHPENSNENSLATTYSACQARINEKLDGQQQAKATALEELESKYLELQSHNGKSKPNLIDNPSALAPLPSQSTNTWFQIFKPYFWKFVDVFDFASKKLRDKYGLSSNIVLTGAIIFEVVLSPMILVYIAAGVAFQLLFRLPKYIFVDRPRQNAITQLQTEHREKEELIQAAYKNTEALTSETDRLICEAAVETSALENTGDISDLFSAVALHTAILHPHFAAHALARATGFFDGALHPMAWMAITGVIIVAIVAPEVALPLAVGAGVIAGIAAAAIIFGAIYAERAYKKELEAEQKYNAIFAQVQKLASELQQEIAWAQQNQPKLTGTGAASASQQDYQRELDSAKSALTKISNFYEAQKGGKFNTVAFSQIMAELASSDKKSGNMAPLPAELAEIKQPPMLRRIRDGFGVVKNPLYIICILCDFSYAWTAFGINIALSAINVMLVTWKAHIDSPRENNSQVLSKTTQQLQHHLQNVRKFRNDCTMQKGVPEAPAPAPALLLTVG